MNIRAWIGRLNTLEVQLILNDADNLYLEELARVRRWWMQRSWQVISAPWWTRDELVIEAVRSAYLLGHPCWGDEWVESEQSLSDWATDFVMRSYQPTDNGDYRHADRKTDPAPSARRTRSQQLAGPRPGAGGGESLVMLEADRHAS